MMRRERLYWADTVYDRLDRLRLLDLLAQAGYVHNVDELAEMGRSELIDTLIDTQTDSEYAAEEAHEDYPLRRPIRTPVPGLLTATARRRVHVRWETDWRTALRSLLEPGAPWDPPASARDGDVVVTVLGCEPPVVAAVEEVGRARCARRPVLLAQPVTWRGLWFRAGAAEPRPSVARLSRDLSARLIQALRVELAEPEPTFLRAGDCTYYRTSPTAIDVLSALQSHQRGGARQARCDSCDAATSLRAHFERPIHENVSLEIQDHIDDVVQLCDDCHRLMHPHSVAAQRRSLHRQRALAAPACPTCGAGRARRIVWGLPADPDLVDDPDTILAGCVVDGAVPAQWRCRACGDDFATVSTATVRGSRLGPPPPGSRPGDPPALERPRDLPRRRNDAPET